MTTKGPAQHHRAGPFNTSNIVNNNDAIIARKNRGQPTDTGPWRFGARGRVPAGTTRVLRTRRWRSFDSRRIPGRGSGRPGSASDGCRVVAAVVAASWSVPIAHLAAPVRVAAQVQHLGEPVGGHVGQAPDALARTAPPSTRSCDHALPPKTNEPGAQRRDHLSSVP